LVSCWLSNPYNEKFLGSKELPAYSKVLQSTYTFQALIVPAPPANKPVVSNKKEGGRSQKLILFYLGNQLTPSYLLWASYACLTLTSNS